MRLTITKRIFLGIALTLTLGIAAIGIIYQAHATVETSLREVTEVEQPTSAAAYEMEISMLGGMLGLVNYLRTGEALYRERVENYRAGFQHFKAQFDRLAETERGKALGNKLAALHREFTALGETLMKRRDDGEKELFASDEFKRVLALRTEMDDILEKEIQALTRHDLTASVREADQAHAYVVRTIAFILPAFILLGLGVAFLMIRVIKAPVRQLMSATEALGQGDLSYRVPAPEGGDELADLAAKFNRMAARLQVRTTDLRTVNESLQAEIAERKRAEQQLEMSARELERSNRELQDFAFIASHDLQEPLRKIQAFGDLLKVQYGGALGGEGADFVARMQNASRRMHVLINDLLSFSRVTTKGQPFVPVDLTDVTREVLTDLEVRLRQTGGQVELDRLPAIEADPLQMRQLLQNLIGNALKFHRPDAPPVVKVGGSDHRECGMRNAECGIA